MIVCAIDRHSQQLPTAELLIVRSTFLPALQILAKPKQRSGYYREPKDTHQRPIQRYICGTLYGLRSFTPKSGSDVK